jgi:hypothetical protein
MHFHGIEVLGTDGMSHLLVRTEQFGCGSSQGILGKASQPLAHRVLSLQLVVQKFGRLHPCQMKI